MDIITTNTSDELLFESPEHLRIHTPVMKRFGNRERIIRPVTSLKTPIHEFSLPFHERKPAFRVGAFPLVKKVCAVNLGSRIRSCFVGAKRAGYARQYGLRVAQIK